MKSSISEFCFLVSVYAVIAIVFLPIVGIPIFAVIFSAVSAMINKKMVKKQLSTNTAEYLDLDYIDENDNFITFLEQQKSGQEEKEKEKE